jgi:TRAP-type C4-dicarboxylate transport system substrate-binding protein
MKSSRLVSVVVCLFLIVSCFSVSSSFAQSKAVKLSFSHFWPATSPEAKCHAAWAKEIEKRTNGRVLITIYPGGTLTPADKIYDGIVTGISGIGSTALTYSRGRFPLMECIDLPLGYPDTFVATKIVNAAYKKFQPKELSDVKVMYLWAHGPGMFYSKKPIRTLEDLKGKKIRTTGLGAKIVSALGGTPVAMTMGETYDALSKNVVDGVYAGWIAAGNWKWIEIIKYYTESHRTAYTAAFVVAMNKNMWEKLPKDIQEIIQAVNEEWQGKMAAVWDKSDRDGLETATKLGVIGVKLSQQEEERWVEKLAPVLKDYVKETKKNGLPGEEMLNFCRDSIKKSR